MEIYKETHCETVESFLDELRKAGEGGGRLFRGVSNADYTLTPSAYREDGLNKLHRLHRTGPFRDAIVPSAQMPFRDWIDLVRQQNALMEYFFEVANRRNLIDLDLDPEDMVRLDGRLPENREMHVGPYERLEQFPRPGALPLLALMQHQGLPTPLLDWTEQLLVACFFASRQNVNKRDDPKQIAVYAMNPAFFRGAMKIALPEKSSIILGLPRLYYPRYRGNANLFAQAGAMTYVSAMSSAIPGLDVSGVFDLREAIEAFWNRLSGDEKGELINEGNPFFFDWVLHKHTLPGSQVPDLRQMLKAYGITASVVFPGLDGVRREIDNGW